MNSMRLRRTFLHTLTVRMQGVANGSAWIIGTTILMDDTSGNNKFIDEILSCMSCLTLVGHLLVASD